MPSGSVLSYFQLIYLQWFELRTLTCIEHPAVCVTQLPFSFGMSCLAPACSRALCSKGTAAQLLFSVLLTWWHTMYVTFSGNWIPCVWQWRTASNVMQRAEDLLGDDALRMPVIHLDIGYKLLSLWFLKPCHRTALLNGAPETPCRLCLLPCWTVEARVWREGRNQLDPWNLWSV